MKTKHTPGPWITNRPEPMINESGLFQIGVHNHVRRTYLSALAFGKTVEEAKQNARLIAAAPELLEALCLANNWLPDLHKAYWATLQTDKREALIEDWDKIKATIKKAKGE